jgi:hypothetical protein
MKPVITEKELDEKIKQKEDELASGDSLKKGPSTNNLLDEYKKELHQCYAVFSSEHIKNNIEKEENVWEVYEGIENLNQKRKDEIDFFFRGYLAYYDEITRNNSINHLLHFKWDEIRGRAIVFICPKPARVFSNPETCPPATAGFSSDPVPPKAPPPPYPR